MAATTTLRIRRRTSGAAGPPASLVAGELAFNEVDGTLYYGSGVGNDLRTATTVVPIAATDLSALFVTVGGVRQTLGALLEALAAQIAAGGGGSSGPTTFTADSIAFSADSTLITADMA